MKILIIIFSLIFLISIISLYVKYGNDYYPLFKSIKNEFTLKIKKSSFIVIIFISVFYGLFFATTLTSISSFNGINNRVLIEASDNNWSQGQIILSEFYVSEINQKENVPAYNDSNGNNKYDKGEELSDNGGSFWKGSDTINSPQELLDRNNWRMPNAVEDIIKNYGNNKDDLLPTFENSNPIYKIPNNEYLYYLDYSLATLMEELNSNDTKVDDFYYSIEAKFNYNKSFKVDNNVALPGSSIQFVMIPDDTIQNTFKGKKINQFLPYNSNYVHPSDNEAYVVNYKNKSFDLKKGSTIEISDSFFINVLDVGYQQDYIKPNNELMNEKNIQTLPDTSVGTDSIVAYVNQQTFYEILELTYYNKKTNEWNQGVYNTYVPSDSAGPDALNAPSVMDITAEILLPYYYSEDAINEYNVKGIKDFYNLSTNYKTTSDSIDYWINNQIKSFGSYLISEYDIYYRGGTSINKSYLTTHAASSSSNTRTSYYTTGIQFQSVSDELSSSINTTNGMFFAISIIGIIATIFIINKLFKENLKNIGIFKAEGYSQSTVSLTILTKVIFTIIIGIFISLAFIPMFNAFWYYFIGNSLIVSYPLFSFTFSSFISTVIFPSLILISISFIFLRFKYVSTPTIDLLKEKLLNDPKYITKKLNSYKLTNNFNIDYSIKNSNRQLSQSLTIFVSSIASSLFLMFTFSINSITTNTLNYVDSSIGFNNLTLLQNDDSTYIRSMEINKYEQDIEDNKITDYTFGSESNSIDNRWYTETDMQTWCNDYDSYIKSYIENESINNRYISVDSIKFISEVVANAPDRLDCKPGMGPNIGLQPPSYFNTISSFVETYSDLYLNFNSSNITYSIKENVNKGLSLGYITQYDSYNYSSIISFGNDIKAYDYEGNKIKDTSLEVNYINSESLKYLVDSSNKYFNTINNYIELSNKEDGVVYFISNGNNNISSVLNSDSTDDYYFDVAVPNGFSSLSNNTNSAAERLDITYYNTISIPWLGSVIINIDDPDIEKLNPNIDLLYTNEIIYSGGPNTTLNFTTSKTNNETATISSISPNPYYTPVSIKNSKKDNLEFKNDLRNGNNLSIADISQDGENFALNTSLLSNNETLVEILNVILQALTNANNSISDERKDEINNTLQDLANADQYGLALSYVSIIQNIFEPSINGYEEVSKPISYLALFLTLILILIVISIILNDNKKNTNIFKIQGYGSLRTTLINYSFYLFILVFGFVISIPIMIGISSFLQAAILPISGIIPVIVKPQKYQFMLLIAVAMLMALIINVLSFIFTKNTKPELAEL